MALRTFPASDGRMWTVWLVQPTRAASPLLGIPQEWLAFQNDDETERRRLREVPPDWADLSDERLDLLRCLAEVVRRPSGGHAGPD
jgi:hypothetical protein